MFVHQKKFLLFSRISRHFSIRTWFFGAGRGTLPSLFFKNHWEGKMLKPTLVAGDNPYD